MTMTIIISVSISNLLDLLKNEPYLVEIPIHFNGLTNQLMKDLSEHANYHNSVISLIPIKPPHTRLPDVM